jgi:hypothetical protein
MKKLDIFLMLGIMAFLALGCGLGDRVREAANSGQSAANGAVDSALEKTGVPECDELLAAIETSAGAKNPDAGFIERTAYEFLKNQVMKPIRDELANTPPDKRRDVAAKCAEATAEIKKQAQRQ